MGMPVTELLHFLLVPPLFCHWFKRRRADPIPAPIAYSAEDPRRAQMLVVLRPAFVQLNRKHAAAEEQMYGTVHTMQAKRIAAPTRKGRWSQLAVDPRDFAQALGPAIWLTRRQEEKEKKEPLRCTPLHAMRHKTTSGARILASHRVACKRPAALADP